MSEARAPCTGCGEENPLWAMRRDPVEDRHYCDNCWNRREQPAEAPPGCEQRFAFYRWLYQSGRIHEYPPEPVSTAATG